MFLPHRKLSCSLSGVSSGHASVGEAAQLAFPSLVFKVTVPMALADSGEGAGIPQSLTARS